MLFASSKTINKQLQNNINHMDSIYQFAILIIAVIATIDASNNIPGLLPETRLPLPSTEIFGKNLYVEPVPLHLHILGSRYESRAWTFQERLLANKCLFISDCLAYFTCEKSLRSELDAVEVTPVSHRHVGVAPTVLNPLRTVASYWKERDRKEIAEEEAEYTKSCIAPYFELVRQYSQRSLTYESDICNAFAGIAVRLQRSYSTGLFVYGMPFSSKIFLPALHWMPGAKRL